MTKKYTPQKEKAINELEQERLEEITKRMKIIILQIDKHKVEIDNLTKELEKMEEDGEIKKEECKNCVISSSGTKIIYA